MYHPVLAVDLVDPMTVPKFNRILYGTTNLSFESVMLNTVDTRLVQSSKEKLNQSSIRLHATPTIDDSKDRDESGSRLVPSTWRPSRNTLGLALWVACP